MLRSLKKVIGPDEFAMICKEIVNNHNGHEAHRMLDQAVTNLLTNLGYGEGMRIFIDHVMPYHAATLDELKAEIDAYLEDERDVMTDENNAGDCENCGSKMLSGHIIYPYRDINGVHMDCEDPYRLPNKPSEVFDPEGPEPVILAGRPPQNIQIPERIRQDALRAKEPNTTPATKSKRNE